MEERFELAAEFGIPPSDAVLIGGLPVLDFVNSERWHRTDKPVDTIISYREAVVFASRVGLLEDESELKAVVAAAESDPRHCVEALRVLLRVRATIYRIFSAIARGKEPAAADLDALRGAHADAVRHAAIVPCADGFTWSWNGTDPWRRVARPLGAVAMQLLLSPHQARVKQCAREGCGWLFLDQSKNGSRRWCTMDICGSRVKMRAHYRRMKAQKA
jgi:predicted RNA-binding Zn ribbon-like protein